METENIDGKKKYKLHFNTSWSEPTQPFDRNEKWIYKDWIEINAS